MKPKLLLWDSDGCLVDSLGISMQNFVDAVTPYLEESQLPTYQEIFDNYLGANEESDVLKMAKSHGISEDDISDVGKRFGKIKQANLLKISLFEGIGDVVSLTNKKGIKQAVVTGRDKDAAYKIWTNKNCLVEGKPVSDYFDLILAGEDYPGKLKAFDLVHKKFGFDKKEVIVLGDEAKDISFGNKMGFVTGATLWGTFEKDKLLNEHPTLLFGSTMDLLKFIK